MRNSFRILPQSGERPFSPTVNSVHTGHARTAFGRSTRSTSHIVSSPLPVDLRSTARGGWEVYQVHIPSSFLPAPSRSLIDGSGRGAAFSSGHSDPHTGSWSTGVTQINRRLQTLSSYSQPQSKLGIAPVRLRSHQATGGGGTIPPDSQHVWDKTQPPAPRACKRTLSVGRVSYPPKPSRYKNRRLSGVSRYCGCYVITTGRGHLP